MFVVIVATIFGACLLLMFALLLSIMLRFSHLQVFKQMESVKLLAQSMRVNVIMYIKHGFSIE